MHDSLLAGDVCEHGPDAQPDVACDACPLSALCFHDGVDDRDLTKRSGLVSFRHNIRRGQHLFHCGEPFRHLYAVQKGTIKSYALDREGNEQVLAFHLPGEFAGLDAMYLGVRPSCGMALETTSVCVLDYQRIVELAAKGSQREMHHHINSMMSREIYQFELFFGDHPADTRVAAFLLNLSLRQKPEGDADASHVPLPMTRTEMGSYLRLATETVSRILRRLHRSGIIQLGQGTAQIIDRQTLDKLAHPYGQTAE